MLVVWGKGHVVQRSQDARMKQKVQSVNMVVGRLLEIKPIRPHLALRFSGHDIPALVLPTKRGAQFRTERADEKQGDSLAQQVGVW